MSLKDKRSAIINYAKDHKSYLGRNHEIYDIFRGNLLPYVKEILKKTLSENYYSKIESRIIPINVLERYVKKISSAYENPPKRVANKESYQAIVDYYVREMSINHKMQIADQYSNMFKGYALDPFMDVTPKLRVLPFDRFLVYSDNPIDPSSETLMIKILGKKNINGKMIECYFTYTDEEFDAFDENGVTYQSALDDNDGVNPIGEIPLVYGNRSDNELLPVQDTDILEMGKLISVFLSDMSGAILFQCFSIVYGVDVNSENLIMSPNAFWSFKSIDDKKPEIGTIKPQADIDQVLRFVVSTFTMWLETKGIRVGSMGNIDAGNIASGISKIIDEMDVYRVVKESIGFFEKEEQEFWHKMALIHNNWIDTGMLDASIGRFGDDFEIQIIFPEPQPKRARKDLIEEKKLEVDAGFKSRRKAIMELNPEMNSEELDKELLEIEGENTEVIQDQLIVEDGQV